MKMFYAWQNGGAWLNGKRISVKQNAELEKSFLTGYRFSILTTILRQWMNT
jgi:fructose-1,6-bisphosphatase/inositol monophosphatase family enzyme